MTLVTAQKLLNIVSVLEGMLGELGAKETFLKHKIKDCKTELEMEAIKNATIILNGEMQHINTTIQLVEDLSCHLQLEAAA